MQMTENIDFRQVPRGWALCYVSECPRKSECLRYQACLQAPLIRYLGKCVMPNVLKQEECPMFRPVQKVRVAVGFRHIFDRVLAKDVAQMRAELKDFFGSRTTCYRYQIGRQPLNPRQQQWIKDLFRRHGYNDDIAFDESKDVYIFD